MNREIKPEDVMHPFIGFTVNERKYDKDENPSMLSLDIENVTGFSISGTIEIMNEGETHYSPVFTTYTDAKIAAKDIAKELSMRKKKDVEVVFWNEPGSGGVTVDVVGYN